VMTKIKCARTKGDEIFFGLDGDNHTLWLRTETYEGSAAFALSPATAPQLRNELVDFIEAGCRVT
jgi:hypothetical protein